VSEQYVVVQKQLQHIPEEYIDQCTLDGENSRKQQVLREYDLLVKSYWCKFIVLWTIVM